jgi:O-antigen/teichoic acid export membrane protein
VTRELKIDLLFNYAALGMLALGGFAMNLIVVRFAGEKGLGVFNQIYAIFITASQLAVGGVHLSVLRSVAQLSDPGPEAPRVIASGLALSLASGVAVAAIVAVTRGFWSRTLGSPAVAEGLLFAAPALVLFSLNKTLLAALNGSKRMRVFAVLQALRFGVLVTVLAVLAWRGQSAAQLAASFLCAEAVVFAAAAASLAFRTPLRFRDVDREWLIKHARFGAQGVSSGVLIELNTRVDVLVIGLYWTDEHVGRYSLAAIFAEGLYQCLVVLRNQMNPVLAKLWAVGAKDELLALVRRAWRYVYPGIVLAYLAALGVLALLLRHGFAVTEPNRALLCFAILGLGVVIVAGFVPFDGLLLLAGKPAHYTLFTFSIVLSNAALLFALVPRFGIEGAAAATGLALAISIASLTMIMQWQFGFTYVERRSPSS